MSVINTVKSLYKKLDTTIILLATDVVVSFIAYVYFLVVRRLDLEEFAVFAAILAIINVLMIFSLSLMRSSLINLSKVKKPFYNVSLLQFIIIIISAIFFIITAAFAKPLGDLLGIPTAVVYILGFYIPSDILRFLTLSYLYFREQYLPLAFINVTEPIVRIILALILLPRYGLYGAIIPYLFGSLFLVVTYELLAVKVRKLDIKAYLNKATTSLKEVETEIEKETVSALRKIARGLRLKNLFAVAAIQISASSFFTFFVIIGNIVLVKSQAGILSGGITIVKLIPLILNGAIVAFFQKDQSKSKYSFFFTILLTTSITSLLVVADLFFPETFYKYTMGTKFYQPHLLTFLSVWSGIGALIYAFVNIQLKYTTPKSIKRLFWVAIIYALMLPVITVGLKYLNVSSIIMLTNIFFALYLAIWIWPVVWNFKEMYSGRKKL